MKLVLNIFALFCASTFLVAQTYNNPGGTINTCSGTFYDSGGPGNFMPSESTITTFCSNNGGGSIVIDFANYDLYPDPSGCYIKVYDGPTNNPGDLIATLTGTNYSAPTYTSTGTCLTFEFYSCNWCGYFPGWVASISCQAPATCTEGDCASCNELGFENISPSANETCLTGWELLKGKNDVAGPYTVESSGSTFANCRGTALAADIYHPSNCSSNINIYDGASNHHDVINASSGISTDYHQSIPAVPNLSGSNSTVIRLGESAPKCFAANAEGMTTTFTVTDPFIAYHYLLKFENTGHTDNDRGFCTFEIRDNNGLVLPCGSFRVYENGASNPGENWVFDATYTNAQSSQHGIWYMSDWNTVILDVSDYIGQELEIEVWVADCQPGAHGSWGYFDFECLTGVTPDCSITPLPVEFYDFKATCTPDNIKLTWKTASERNNDYFILWESEDGENYSFVDKIPGAGSSSNTLSYEYTTEYAPYTSRYYRISQFDFDGKETQFYSLASPSCQENQEIQVQTKPGKIIICGEDLSYANITDLSGRLVFESVENRGIIQVDTDQIGSGVYLIHTIRRGIESKTVRVLIP